MDRNREARRGTMAATANGMSRRRQRSSSLRASPEEDDPVELQETSRFRDRSSKKDRERDRDRDRSSRSKRRRAERSQHGSNREEEGEDSTGESVDEEEDEEYEDAALLAVRLPLMNPTASAASMSSSIPNHQQRKSFPTKVMRQVAPWKVADEMIGVSVPRKTRSAAVKRSHECRISGEPIQPQSSTSPARPNTVAAVPAAPISPSSSNVSVRKKMKPSGTKHRPPKVSKTSSIQETEMEMEMEIAEVLYGMTRQIQSPSKQEIVVSASQKLNSKDANGSNNEAKSRGSSPIAISTVVAPKRKRRPIKSEEDSPAKFSVTDASVYSEAKIEVEQQAKVEISSPRSEKNLLPAVENSLGSLELGNSQIASAPPELPQDSLEAEGNCVPDSELPKAESDGQDVSKTKEEIASSVEESSRVKIDADLEDAITTKPESAVSTVDCLREEKFKIDLMAPPSGKSSPERDDLADLVTDQKPPPLESKQVPKKEIVKAEEENAEGIVEEAADVALTEKKTQSMVEDLESQKQTVKERILDLQLDEGKLEKDSNKLQVQKQLTKASRSESKAEKTVHSASLPLPMTIAGWPGALPPIGYVGQIPPPLPGVVSIDGGTGSSTRIQQPNFLLPQPRPKRCASHYYIAQTINYHRQITTRMTPFWPGATGSAPLYGTTPCNLNVGPPTESTMLGNPLQGSIVARNLSSLPDKGSAAAFTGHSLKDKSPRTIFMDTVQRKQLMLQQASQPASANNILQAPAFIFPLNQQQSAAVTQSGAVKSVTTIGNAASSPSVANSVVGSAASSGSASATGLGSATTVSFNYANMPTTHDAQYLAMLQSNGYPFPIPGHVGLPPPYGGSHHPAVPFFNGPFFSPQMLHPTLLSQQQQQQSQSQPLAVQPGNQNTSTSSGSSSSQKHQQQQRQQGCIGNGGGGISHGFPNLKQCQRPQQQYLPPHHSRQLESETGNDDSPSTADSRVSHAQKSVYNHNFAMPIHPQNFSIMSPAAFGGGNQVEKQQQQSTKGGMELNQSQTYAVSFATFNGTAAAPGLDFSSMSQNHAVFQSHPEAARRGYQTAASAAPSQPASQKNYQTIEEGKPVSDSIDSNACGEDERKKTGKALTPTSHSLTFCRPDNDPSVSTILGKGNSTFDSSSRTLNVIPASGNGSRASSRSGSVPPATTNGTTDVTNTPNSLHHHQQLIKQQQLQHQLTARMKSSSSNANVYSDRPSSAMAKFSNTIAVFPQALPQGGSPTQSPPWKTLVKAGTTPIPSPSQALTPSAKSLPQQQGRTQLGVPAAGHAQISFGMNTKSSSVQQFPSNMSPSSAGVGVGSPPTSISKSAGGSPRTTTGSKAGPSTMPLPSQPAKNMSSSSSRKSSPVSGRHGPANLCNSNFSSAQSATAKPQQQQVQNQHHQQLHTQSFHQAQPFFSNMCMQAQSPQSTTTSSTSGYYQKRQSEHQQQQQQNSSAVSSSGMLSLCSPPVPFPGVAISDPAKAVAAAAAAANNLKGLPPQGLLHAAHFAAQSAGNPHLLMSAAIPYIHSVPAVPVKSAEQKPTSGN